MKAVRHPPRQAKRKEHSMRDLDENSITQAVLESFSATSDRRLKYIMTRLVEYLHGFIREIEPSMEEWNSAIDFLTRAGQICTKTRQEFILLSDTLGVSTLVDSLNHRGVEPATASSVLGPFYVSQAPERNLGSTINGELTGEPLLVAGQVTDLAGNPLANAVVDTWHADGEGFYDVQHPELEALAMRAKFHTDQEGRFYFWSILPRYYPIPHDGPVGEMLAATGRHPNRPAHVHFMINAPGFQPLVSQIFVDQSPYLDSDSVFGVKSSLIAPYTSEPAGVALDGTVIATPYRQLAYQFALPSDKSNTRHTDFATLAMASRDGK